MYAEVSEQQGYVVESAALWIGLTLKFFNLLKILASHLKAVELLIPEVLW